jgi:hypothetical protein
VSSSAPVNAVSEAEVGDAEHQDVLGSSGSRAKFAVMRRASLF